MKSIVVLTVLLIAGCSSKQESHVITKSGTERGVEINVMLEGGGKAKLVCPLFKSKPLGSHGRECYLRSYKLTK